MFRSRFGRWLIDVALPAMACCSGYAWVPTSPVESEAPSLQAQIVDFFELVAREEKRWGARHRVGEKR